MSIRGFVAERKLSVKGIRRLWFEYSTFDPSEFALLVKNERVYGLVFARASGNTGYVWICFQPHPPRYYVVSTIETLLSWSRHRIESRRASIVRIDLGYEYSIFYRVLYEILGSGVETTVTTLMEYYGENSLGENLDIAVRRGTLRDVPGIVNVWNNAFRKYSWFREWRYEDAVRWYSTRKPLVYVALDPSGEKIIGYVDGEARRGFDGNLYGYIYTLAVHPDVQGRGVDKTLLQYMVNELLKTGARKVYLDAIEGLEKYYMRQGFRIARRSRSLYTFTSRLPMFNTMIDTHTR